MAGGLPGGPGDVPLGARPDVRVPGVHLHLRLGRLLRVGRGDRPGDVRRDPGSGRRGPLGARRRLVGRAGLQPARRASPSSARRSSGSATSSRAVREDGDRRLQRRPLRSSRDAAPDPATSRHGLLRLHAARSARDAPARADLLVGVAGRLARAHLSGCRTSTARRARTSATTSTSRSPSCPTAGPR